jgi:hypothetical protein
LAQCREHVDADAEMRLAAAKTGRLEDAMHTGAAEVIDCCLRQCPQTLAFIGALAEGRDYVARTLQYRFARADRWV